MTGDSMTAIGGGAPFALFRDSARATAPVTTISDAAVAASLSEAVAAFWSTADLAQETSSKAPAARLIDR
jgi:hypothetical protein